MRILGREPAEWLAFVAVCVQLAVGFGLELSDVQQGLINAAATAVMGLLVAAMAARDQIAAAAGGLLVAGLQLAVGFGLEPFASVEQETIMLAGVALTTLLGFVLRTQVTAPVSADGSKVETISPATSPSHR